MKYDVECFMAFWQCVFYLLTDKLIYITNNLRTTTVGMGCIQNGTDYH